MAQAEGVSTSRSAAVSGRGLTLCVEYLPVSEMNMDNHVKGFSNMVQSGKRVVAMGGSLAVTVRTRRDYVFLT